MAPRMATMDDENLALCKVYRQPPDGSKPLAYSKIAAKVKRRDGHRPSAACVCLAACSLGVVVYEERSGASALAVVCSLLCVSLCVCVCVCVQRGARTESARNTFQNQILRRTAHLFSKLACCCGLPSQVARSASGRPKEKVGRKKGWRKTTADEDKRAA